jgi:hypothetical protein
MIIPNNHDIARDENIIANNHVRLEMQRPANPHIVSQTKKIWRMQNKSAPYKNILSKLKLAS